ncbi:MAG: hypothetical protein U0575_09555 [Phycisphaerales bacterium]
MRQAKQQSSKAGTAICAAVMATVISGAAEAQVRPYRVVRLRWPDGSPLLLSTSNLTKLGFPETTGSDLPYNRLSINDDSEVVGSYYDPVANQNRAFAWRPVGAVGSAPTGVVLNLHALGGMTTSSSSAANDINNAGFVVGHAGAGSTSVQGHAWLWRLDQYNAGSTPVVPSVDLQSTTLPVPLLSVAYGINDDANPTVVGVRTRECYFDYLGFRLVFPSLTMLDLVPEARSAKSFAFDVMKPAAPPGAPPGAPLPPLRIVGRDAAFSGDNLCAPTLNFDECVAPDADAIRWDGSGYVPFLLPAFAVDPRPTTTARRVNSSGDAVGYGFQDVYPVCGQEAAVWWDDALGTHVYSLGLLLDLDCCQVDKRSRAEGVSNRRVVNDETKSIAVGWNTDDNVGLVWYGFANNWCMGNVNAMTLLSDGVPASRLCTLQHSGDDETIVQLYDVNAFGHAVGILRAPLNEPPTRYYAIALTSSADLDGDFDVDGGDLGTLLASWCGGAFPPCQLPASRADLNCDGLVDGGDLGALLAGWSGSGTPCVVGLGCPLPLFDYCECPGASQAAALAGLDEPLNGDEAPMNSPLDPSIAAAITALGFAGVDGLVDWSSGASLAQLEAIGQALNVLLGGG